MIPKKVTIISINYNGLPDTIELLESLKKAKIPKNLTTRIIIVDNASKDDAVKKIKHKYPEVEVIISQKNLGFAGGNNLGIKNAIENNTDWIVLINNDCIVSHNFFINLEKSAINKPDTGVLGGLIYFARGYEFHQHYQVSDLGKVIWYAGGNFDWQNIIGSHNHIDEVDEGNLTVSETGFVSGALFITRREVLEKSGLFDEKYFMYLEDVDLCHRINQLGYKIIFDPKIKIWHKVAQSSAIGSSLNDYFLTRNRLLFGFSYTSFKTKFALFREAIRKYISGSEAQKSAIKDFFTHRFYQGSWLK